ncbi:aspartate aminotransferase family protein [Candidatus Entotheonella palauensis]|uniref:aspartate aminotransferase family protein n=1 Tax=Candidatus Entotheonella palauensis TaxID=93172 RepID=UPI000B7ED4E0|nr:aminotransferase class III-fold pyridoxal phosphate-dependent enzyme [Candidatus Entotheonella palauensis]
MSAVDERYYQLHPKSVEMSKEAEHLFPDGVTHDGRKSQPFRIYMDCGLGPRKWDIDGNEYIDYRTGHGSMLLGQAHPRVIGAVQEQLSRGTHLSASTEIEVQWAKMVQELVPCAEKLRFVASGTEAMMLACRMARSHSGKTKVVKFDQAFHGWADGPFVGAEHDHAGNGIPPQVRETMVVMPYDLDEVERILDTDPDIAAVMFQGNQVKRPEFIRGLREITEKKGVILIFDEVVSGFRWSRGGCQGLYGVTPDLSGMAKILAGGFPGGAVAGRADIIDTIAPDKIAHPGTFNANPVSAVAGVTALEIVANEPITETADARANQLKDGLNDILTRLAIPGCAYGVSSIVHMRLGLRHDCDKVYCEAGEQAMMTMTDDDTVDLLRRALVNEGVWGGPTSFILSATHTEQDIETTLESYENALQAVRAEGAI